MSCENIAETALNILCPMRTKTNKGNSPPVHFDYRDWQKVHKINGNYVDESIYVMKLKFMEFRDIFISFQGNNVWNI